MPSVRRTALPVAAALVAAFSFQTLWTDAIGEPPSVDRRAVARTAVAPLGLPPVPVPANNPLTPDKVALGRKLFFDRRLSHDNTISCATCHVPEQGFTVNELATAVGIEGRIARRNAPTVINAAYLETIFHDGRETSLETQALAPLVAPDEMGNPSLGHLVAKVKGLGDYHGLFEKAFGRGPGIEALAAAIAAWERTLVSADSPFDRWYYGGAEDAIGAPAKHGFELFTGKAGCVRCHALGKEFALFTDNGFHDTGVGYRNTYPRSGDDEGPSELAPRLTTIVKASQLEALGEKPGKDLGRYEVTLRPGDAWRYKTPSLRNVALTGPYMHDGSLLTLREVVYFYARGGVKHPGLDRLIGRLDLEDGAADDLAAFMESLTGGNIAELVADARSILVGNPRLEDLRRR